MKTLTFSLSTFWLLSLYIQYTVELVGNKKDIFFMTKVSRFYTSGELNLTSMYVLSALFQSCLDTLYSVYRSLYVYMAVCSIFLWNRLMKVLTVNMSCATELVQDWYQQELIIRCQHAVM